MVQTALGPVRLDRISFGMSFEADSDPLGVLAIPQLISGRVRCESGGSDVLAAPDAVGQPLVTSTAAQLLVATVLAVFPNNALTEPTIEDRHDAHPDTLRRAIAFIDEHAHQDITIADIAGAAFVTIRAVQLAFRRHLDTTPLHYLRRVRLERATTT